MSSIQLLRCVMVHCVVVCFSAPHRTGPGRVEGRFGRMSRRLAYARRPGRGFYLFENYFNSNLFIGDWIIGLGSEIG